MKFVNRRERVYIAGHTGMAGSALLRHFQAEGFTDIVYAPSTELDLREKNQVVDFFNSMRPRHVILAAAKVGGILANEQNPVEFLGDNLAIQNNVMTTALAHKVERLVFLGSSCVYPKHAPQPVTEDSLLTGQLEFTNEAYSIAKIAGVMFVKKVREQYNLPWISVMPTNLYGPGDNYDYKNSHVFAAMIRRFIEATEKKLDSTTCWGTGLPRREFMHVDDFARACLLLMENSIQFGVANVGVGYDLAIKDLAELVAKAVGFEGVIEWDPSKPDGTPQKLLDLTILNMLAFEPKFTLEDGISHVLKSLKSCPIE